MCVPLSPPQTPTRPALLRGDTAPKYRYTYTWRRNVEREKQSPKMSASTKSEDRTRLDGFELEIFKLVREHATSEQWREWLRAPLEHAAADGNMDLFNRLMDAGADGGAGWRGCNGRTLLGAAVHGKSEEIVQALLKAGAKDEVDAKFGDTLASALHAAAAGGVASMTNTLILAGADPNVLDAYKESSLHLAAENGHDGVASILLLKGADPNVKERRAGQTPLHFAACEDRSALCVSTLVAGGADKDSFDLDGRTPLHMAAQGGCLGAVEQLLAAGANVHIRQRYGISDDYSFCDVLDFAAEVGAVDVAKAILRYGSSVTAKSMEKGFTALHYCAAYSAVSDRDNSGVVRVLLDAWADVDAKSLCGSTPLQLAAYAGSSATVRALLEGGANPHFRRGGGTPLETACHASNADVVELLLRWGVDEKLTWDTLGKWQNFEDRYYELDGCPDDEKRNWRERKAADQRIRHMLARAPADRCWRRRGWLVLARSCPVKVHLAHDSNSNSGSGSGGGSSGGSTAKTAKAITSGGDRGSDETAALARLVSRVVKLDAEGVFRLVVGFL